MHRFEAPSTQMTLAEGLAEYYASNPHLKRGQALPPQARDFFRCHDAAHVVFGCGTALPDEAVVKLASVFGTTGGLSVLRGYALYDSLDIIDPCPFAKFSPRLPWRRALCCERSPDACGNRNGGRGLISQRSWTRRSTSSAANTA